MKQILKNRTIVIVIVMLFAVLLISGCSSNNQNSNSDQSPSSSTSNNPSPAPASTENAAEPIVLSYVSFVPPNNSGVVAFDKAFVDKLNERANGELILEFRGGPDVFAALDIGDAVKSGAVDIGYIYFGAYEALTPGVAGLTYSQLEPEEELDIAYDYVEELHNVGGLHWLGRSSCSTGNFFRTWMRKPVEKTADLKNMLIGSSTGGQPAVEGWGAAWVNVEVADNYTALEQGVVDAIAAQSYATAYTASYYEVAPYSIDHAYFKATTSYIMNLDKYNSLPEHLQKLIDDVAREATTEITALVDADNIFQRAELEKLGHTFIKFEPADAELYVQLAYDRGWARQMEKYPEQTPKLKELLTKN